MKVKTWAFSKKSLIMAMALVSGDIALANDQSTSESNILEEIHVLGTRGALMNAMETQRNAKQVASVVDSDAMGNFADINVAESLRRVSGIMVENDQGEGRYVSVRGMNTDLNAMTINGVSTASPENRRGIMLDGVPTDMLDSITVFKTLTPNLDSDTIGGAINLETISAFKYDGLHARIKADTSYNDMSKDGSNPKLALTATNRFELGDGELGVALTLSDQTRRIVSINNETGGWGEQAINEDYEMRYYDLERERQGVVLNFDYHSANGNEYYARFFHNEYTETEERAKWEVRRAMEETPAIDGDIATYPFQRIDTESRPRVELRSISSAQIGAEFELNDRTDVKFEVFGSQAEQDDTDKWNVIFRSDEIETSLTYDNSNPKKPVINFSEVFYDARNFKLNALEAEYALTQDQDIGLKADVTFELNDTTELQYGFKYRERQKDNDFDFCGYEPVNDSTLDQYAHEVVGKYMNNIHGPAPKGSAAHELAKTLGEGNFELSDGTVCRAPGNLWTLSGDEDEESIAADWYSDENILATYVMATTETERAIFVYGVRYENTQAEFRGKQFDGEAYAGSVSYEKDYDFFAPSFNAKFDLTDDQVVRVGIFRSLVRPGFGESSAGASIDLAENEISGGNPHLDPTTAWNFDVSYEWYIDSESMLSAGIFYKDIDDSILAVEAANIQLRGNTWDLGETYVNAGKSSIAGFEFGAQTAWENGMLISLNYTYADGTTDLPSDSAYGVRSIPYFKQAKHTANMSVGYNDETWDVRLAANYRSEFLDSIGGSALTDRYASEHVQLDLTAKYKVNEQFSINASAINLNDRPEYYYFGNKNRLSQYDEFGRTYEIGVSYTF
ncbi:MAG: TonB-dependent receptor [Cellvibrio sp.]